MRRALRALRFVVTIWCGAHVFGAPAGAQSYRDSLDVMRAFGEQMVLESPNVHVSLGEIFLDTTDESMSRSLTAAAAAVSPRIHLRPVYRTAAPTAAEQAARVAATRGFYRRYFVDSMLVTADSGVLFVARYFRHTDKPGRTTLAEMRYIVRRAQSRWSVSSAIVDVWSSLIDPELTSVGR